MKRLWRHIKKEWEKALCLAAALLLCLFGLHWLLTAESSFASGGTGTPPSHQVPFEEAAFAFLGPHAAPADLPRNPFQFKSQSARPKPERQRRQPDTKPPPEPEEAVEKRPKEKPEEETETAADPPAAEENESARPSPRPQIRLAAANLKFVFYNINQSGKPVALVELHNPARPGAAPLARTLSVGDTLMGLKILAVSEQSITLRDAAGNRRKIALNDQQRLAIRVVPNR